MSDITTHGYQDNGHGRCMVCAQAASHPIHTAGLTGSEAAEMHDVERFGPQDSDLDVPPWDTMYTHIVRRASGYIAGWFTSEPPAEFVAECNASVPDQRPDTGSFGRHPPPRESRWQRGIRSPSPAATTARSPSPAPSRRTREQSS